VVSGPGSTPWRRGLWSESADWHGTSLALVGAYILAGELAVSNDAGEASQHDVIQAAFDRYETRLRPYVQQGQQLPPGGADG
jgi:hypothetical protein